MRKVYFFMLLVSIAATSAGQLTITPQAGIENPSTRISYNDLASFDPVKLIQPNIGLRADYKFKGGFGPYIGFGTNQSRVDYNFADPETGMNVYSAKAGNMEFQLNAGIQYSSKAFSLGRSNAKKGTESSKAVQKPQQPEQKYYYTRCGQKVYYSRCESKSKTVEKKKTAPAKNWTMRLQPSFGFAYIPNDEPLVVTKAGSYTYNAGQMKTALTGGMGFEFARGKSRMISLRVNYFQGLNDNKAVLTTNAGTKTVTTTFDSKVSGWSTTVGIPISIDKKAVKKTSEKKNHCEKKVYYRCGEKRVIRF